MTKRCRRCDEVKPEDDFWSSEKNNDGLQSWCAECHKAYKKERACSIEVDDKECARCGITRDEDDFYKDTTTKDGLDTYCKPCREYLNYERRIKCRTEVFNEYGPKCECCGEDNLWLLTIDHVNGRKGHEMGGADEYRRLIREDFPEENIQVLCYNCNCAKGFFGMCPHKESPLDKLKVMASRCGVEQDCCARVAGSVE